MQAERPSRTAYRVALRRAAHQVFDQPVVFPDPFALPILGLSPDRLGPTDLRAPNRPSSRSLRAYLVARSLFAEETLAAAVQHNGVTQYVLLGAGLDTFALRNPHPTVRVFEVDHPATQAWKARLVREAGLPQPRSLTRVPVDFETEDLSANLLTAGLPHDQPALFAMLGVVPYLTSAAFAATLRALSQRPAWTGLLLDYGLPRYALPPREQLMLDSLAARVAGAGEPFQLFFTPEEMAAELAIAGFAVQQQLDPAAMNDRFFTSRGSALQILGTGARLLYATAAAPL